MDHESKLIRAVSAGDTERFRELVEAHQLPVLRFLGNLIGDRQDAEDVAQEVFLTAFQTLATFDPNRGRFLTWLFTLARSRGLNRLRTRRPSPSATLPDTAVSASTGDLQEELDRAFTELPTDQRTAFLLSEIEQLTYEEIARVERVPVGTVRSRIHRARQRLRVLLEHVREEA